MIVQKEHHMLHVKTYDEKQNVTTQSLQIGRSESSLSLNFSWAHQKGDWWQKDGTPKFLWASRYKGSSCHGKVLHVGRLAIALLFSIPHQQPVVKPNTK